MIIPLYCLIIKKINFIKDGNIKISLDDREIKIFDEIKEESSIEIINALIRMEREEDRDL